MPGAKGNSKTSPAVVEQRQKDIEILRLRSTGMSITEIGAEVGLHHSNVSRAITRTLKQQTKLAADQYASLQIMRLERAIRAVWPDVEAGKLRAIDRLVKLITLESRILGLFPNTRAGAEDGEAGEVIESSAAGTQIVALILQLTEDEPSLRYKLAAKLDAIGSGLELA